MAREEKPTCVSTASNFYAPLAPISSSITTPSTADDRVPLLDVLMLRAWANDYLVRAGELDLHNAIDTLQADAERIGLVDILGQDRVQQILADAFKDDASEVTASSDHQLIKLPNGAEQVVIDALFWAYREGGIGALDRPENQERWSRLSLAQRDEQRLRIRKVIQ